MELFLGTAEAWSKNEANVGDAIPEDKGDPGRGVDPNFWGARSMDTQGLGQGDETVLWAAGVRGRQEDWPAREAQCGG